MKCEACERGDHDNCGMQTWCDCGCEGYQDGIYLPDGHYFQDDLDGGRLIHKEKRPMFHNTDNLFFGRLPDGKVRILKLPSTPAEFPKVDGAYPDAIFDVTIDDGHWGSIVSSVSAKGEADGRWYRAMDFHHGRA